MNKKSSEKRKKYCKVCDKLLTGSKYHIESHLYRHGLIQARFRCTICAKEYYRKDVYTRHMKVHGGELRKSFTCDHCERVFVDKRNLILHLRVHDDLDIKSILKFECNACGIAYNEKRLLLYHVRKNHYNLQSDVKFDMNNVKCDRPWIERVMDTDTYVEMKKIQNNVLSIKKCELRDGTKSYESNEKNLNGGYINSIFAATETSQYSKAVCDYCKKEMLKKSLKSHIRERHLKIRRFQCDRCKKTFNRHYQMVNHVCGKFKRKSRN